ncbi:MAG TPA: SGNH/GDSL hydrolase family protein [Deltaproteobacteria bacterium]|nr:SGNH/GDSL hydrolase family protein [Deltaproteobacteria bacterium]
MKRFFRLMVFLIGLLLIINIGILGVRVGMGINLARDSEAFQFNNPGASKRVLIVGDSTGVGTGAASPEDSIAGRIARDFPWVEITNTAEDGEKMVQVLTQINALGDEAFDLVIVQAGGNDILRFTRLASLEQQLVDLLGAAGAKGGHVIFISTGNVGLAPAFFAPISWVYTVRTRQVRDLFQRVSRELGVEYVDLFKERKDDPFLDDPHRFFARDLLHPGSEGYALWYEEIRRQTSLVMILSPELSEN